MRHSSRAKDHMLSLGQGKILPHKAISPAHTVWALSLCKEVFQAQGPFFCTQIGGGEWRERGGVCKAVHMRLPFLMGIFLCVFLIGFIEIQFTFHTIHSFKVFNSMVFSLFTELCNHFHYIIFQHVYHPKSNLLFISYHFPLP